MLDNSAIVDRIAIIECIAIILWSWPAIVIYIEMEIACNTNNGKYCKFPIYSNNIIDIAGF